MEHLTFQTVKLVAGCALIGSVLTGVIFGWIDTSFDPRVIGAGVGAATGAAKAWHLF